jgi:hypothetical protein
MLCCPATVAAVVTATTLAGSISAARPPRTGVVEPGWAWSYAAGYTDSNGRYAGGSEILHLVTHKGKLYAGVSYWFDPRNVWYGGKDPSTGWGQVLRLDGPGRQWEVDLEMGHLHLRPEIIKSVTITTDGQGRPLPEPVNLLMVATYAPRPPTVDINVFVRDDRTGSWHRTTILTGPKPPNNEHRSVRDIHVHRDRVTGVDRIFISIGLLGVFAGVYDPGVPGLIRWGTESESGPVATRPLAIIDANGSLYFSAGSRIYRRNDGPAPTYTVVYDASEITDESIRSPVGGIRGMSAIPSPDGRGESILFAWAPGSRSEGSIHRLDPDGMGGFTRTEEVRLDQLMTQYLDGNPVYFVLAGYNDILPVTDPTTGEPVHLIGFECWIGGFQFPTAQRKENGGFYAGGMYAIRDSRGRYRLNEVNGPSTLDKPALVATRTCAVSPFAEDGYGSVYFGGNDCNERFHSPNWAWIFSTSLENALRKDAPRPARLTAEQTSAVMRELKQPPTQ